MPRPPWTVLDRFIRRLAPADSDRVPDADLLARFARDRDPAAFELLVWRHGGLVLSTCRRILRDDHLAEDAFQATFLVLARRAGSIRAENVPGWLHRVARRVSAKAARRRRTIQGRETVFAAEPAVTTPDIDYDRTAVVDAEVGRLPERFRLPIVMCYLQGHTAQETAQLLRVPYGTVLSRLSTARRRLADRLARRGVTLPTTLAATAVTSDSLVSATVRSAAAFAAGEAVLTSAPTLLATEVIRMSAWKLPAAVAACFAVLAGVGTGIGVLATEGPWQDGQPSALAKPADPPKAPAEDVDKLRAIKREAALKKLLEHEDAVMTRIRDLDKRRQEANREMGDDVDMKVLMASLERLDMRILQTESNITTLESNVRKAEDLERRFNENQINPLLIENEVRQSNQVAEAVALVNAKQKSLSDLSKNFVAEHPILKTAAAEIESAKADADRVRKKVRVEAQRTVADRERKSLADSVKKYKADHQSYIVDLQSQKKKRSELVQRIARARVIEDANQLIEDELRVYRELRQQLLRQRLMLQIDVDGVMLSLPASVGSDAKVDQLMREVAELKSEVRRLGEARPATGQPVPMGRGGRGGRGGDQ